MQEITVFSLLVESPSLDGPRVTVHGSRTEALTRLEDYLADDDQSTHEIDEHIVDVEV